MDNNNIFKNHVRILRPSEVKEIINAIPKADYKDKFEALLFTGMRYNELRWLYKHKERFTGHTILIPSFKPKAKHKERYIRLNNHGKRAIEHFLRSKRNLPHRDGWNANLRRWSKQAGIGIKGISTKTTRKTWESWLVSSYPTSSALIFLSQGHTDVVSIEYYLMLPFNDQDKQDMKFYTDGWI
jgi:integrase